MTTLSCRTFGMFGYAGSHIYQYFCTDLSMILFLQINILFYIKKLEENARKVFANFIFAWYTVWAIGKESKYVK